MPEYRVAHQNERPPQTLTGILERLTYHNEENGYTVGRLAPTDGDISSTDLITVVGSFSNPIVGELLVCEGRWVMSAEYGRQFAMERYSTARPATAYAIEKYLGSGLIRGVGPVMARRMVGIFAEETLDVIEHDPGKLRRVEGIGEKRIEMIRKAWSDQKEIRNVMLYLQGKGVSSTFAVKIFKRYNDQSIAVVEDNPYRLAQDIWGIGFKTADKIAQQIGIAPDSPRRLEAGLLHTLSAATDFGHMYLPEFKLINSASEILEVNAAALVPALESMVGGDMINVEMLPVEANETKSSRAIYLPALYHTEFGLAKGISSRLATPMESGISRTKLNIWLDKQAQETGVSLSEEQREAVAIALENRISILTGGPGTGKTLTTNTIARSFEARGRRILFASPTGRAAKRLSEVTGRDAQTIHRMLKYDPAKRVFQYNAETPLECDVLIADEVSMLDSVLAHNLLKAVPASAQIVLVGDSDQLPSVGAGNVLGDLLDSGVVPSTRLTKVFRQAEASLIVTNAHRIRIGELPTLVSPAQRAGSNCIFVEIVDSPQDPDGDKSRPSSEVGAQQVVKLVKKTLPALGFQEDDIQVLSPMHRGAIGVGVLNDLIQEAVNPSDPRGVRPELVRGSRRFRIGDRVIQLVNNYDKSVYNGDVGVVKDIRTVDQKLVVRYPDIEVEYDFSEYDELQLAYAMSVHKSQGSEYRAVVLVVHSSQYMMLQRNLIYTGLTRARELCIIVGDKRAISRAVRNNKSSKRFTRLSARLRSNILLESQAQGHILPS